MIDREGLVKGRVTVADLCPAVVLGTAAHLLNLFELQLGWGLHFIFGNALVYAFVRVLRPSSILLAGSISSLRSVFLWNHPWAWVIWTLEAGCVGFFSRKKSPVRTDVIFWLLIGTPLLILSYGVVMEMDRLSLLLVIVKQATNGVLNVMLGEIIYLTLLSLKPLGKLTDWPKMPTQSFVLMILLAVTLIPTAVYLRLDAPAREQAARSSVDRVLTERLRIADATIGMWTESRSLELKIIAQEQLARGTLRTGYLPEELSQEFSGISIIGRDGTYLLTDAENDGTVRQAMAALPTDYVKDGSRSRLVYVRDTSSNPKMLLVVPIRFGGSPAMVIATIREGALQRFIPSIDEDASGETFLVNAAAGILPLSQSTPESLEKVNGIHAAQRTAAEKSAVLISDTSYGNALMSDLRDASMARISAIAALTDWQILTIAPLSPEVLKAREGQVQLFAALCGFIILVTIFGSMLSKRTEQSLRQLAHSVADLAELGTRRDKLDSLVISELDDISSRIAFAGSSVTREHGALLNYQRRLNSIARHAPILVYALEVTGQKKGELLYVSETIEALLGYTRAEVEQAGWWSHAIHAEDYDRCIAMFSELHPGRVIHVEYRLRHKLGYYVWVYDTLSVEANPQSGQEEAVGVLIDISDRKAAAEQLLQADKMASLGRMITGTAHELNQPLNFIKIAASNLREHARRGRLDADHFITKLDSILSHVNRASAIILQMRIFGRMPKELPLPIDVKAAVDAVLTMVAPQLELDGTRAEVSECNEGVKVRALPVQLEQVLLNLILNANDAIRARRNAGDPSEGVIIICVERQDWRAIVSISDNGSGLSADVLPTIFEPFFTTKPPKEGTGLGLPISYGIIRDLGGSITAENIDGGAKFIIELPIAER